MGRTPNIFLFHIWLVFSPRARWTLSSDLLDYNQIVTLPFSKKKKKNSYTTNNLLDIVTATTIWSIQW
jgi:hypothetical protein